MYCIYSVLNKSGNHNVNFIYKLKTVALLQVIFCIFIYTSAEPAGKKWVGTWSTAPQLVEPGNNPPSPGLSNNTLRQIVHVSIGGDTLQVKFSNEFSTKNVVMHEVHIAVSKGGGIIDTATDKVLYFNGNPEVTIRAGFAVTSDKLQFALQPLSDVAITIYFGSTSPDVTGHPGSRTTSYILTGNNVSKESFSGAVTTDHWYVINTIDVMAPETAAAVAIMGNSITDGRGSGTNKQNRWPDELSRRLQANPETQEVAVLNEGIGGNAVLRGGLGPTALNRYKRDVLNQNGVKWFVIFEGVNDIGGAFGADGSAKVATDLIAAFTQMIDTAHARGLIVYGATIMPFKGNGYYSADHDKARQTVNTWIRNSGHFDGVIDFDMALRNPNDTLALLPIADTGDHLHPSETGHKMMAEAVELALFKNSATGINETVHSQPGTYLLLNNYPNPFNPSTTISFTLPEKNFVTIRIFDVLGNEITTLVNEEKSAGTYEVNFDAHSLSSGTYFYKMTSGNFSEVKKMILMR